MNFKLQSLKRNEDKEGNIDFTVRVITESGNTISRTIPADSIEQALEMLSTDVTREIKMSLRKDVAQLELRDESEK